MYGKLTERRTNELILRMAAAVIARKDRVVRMGSSLRDLKNVDLVAHLPDKKDWIADHKIEMLMLDG